MVTHPMLSLYRVNFSKVTPRLELLKRQRINFEKVDS